MIAPACPIRFPGGALRPAINAATGFDMCSLMNAAASSSAEPPISLDHDDTRSVGVLLKQFERIHEVRANHGIAADSNARRLSQDRAR